MARFAAHSLWGVAAILIGGIAPAQVQPLHVIPVHGNVKAVASADHPIRIALYARDPASLSAQLQLPANSVAGDRVEMELGAYRPLAVSGNRTWMESTFVVDFDEEEVRKMHSELKAATSAFPTREQLVNFVAANVEGSLGRGWDLASTVARLRTGDCTEFAVLLTGLSRASSRPARVVTGTVLVETPSGVEMYGHAWSEVQEEGEWRVADAALSGTKVIGYLPLGVLQDEGPNFSLQLVGLMQTWIQRATVM